MTALTITSEPATDAQVEAFINGQLEVAYDDGCSARVTSLSGLPCLSITSRGRTRQFFASVQERSGFILNLHRQPEA